MLPYFPKQFTSKAIGTYFASLLIVSVVFMSHMMQFKFMAIGIVAVTVFFYFANTVSKKMINSTGRHFIRYTFATAFAVRLAWVIFSYFFYQANTGAPFEFNAGDAMMYHDEATGFAYSGSWSISRLKGYFSYMAPSDSGYLYYLATLYSIFGNSIIFARIVKSLFSAWTCILVYKLARRNFGEDAGRLAGIFCIFMPNFIYYCGMHLKETEMVFLIMLYLERADYLLKSRNYKFSTLIVPILAAVSLFFFRTVLGTVCFLALFTAVVFSSSKVVGWGKKILIGLWVILAAGYFVGEAVMSEVEEVWEGRDTNQEARRSAQVNRGVDWAKYATGTVMAPMAFVIPFSTMVDVDYQYNQQTMHGGLFVKNMISVFVILAFIYIFLIKKNWRNFALLEAFTIGYLIVIAFSAFANSERFHLPALPCELMFAAYGVTLVDEKNIKYVNKWPYAVIIMEFAWAFFKLGSRGIGF